VTRVPLVDLHAQYLSIKAEVDGAIADVVRASAFVRGAHVERFEQDFARAIGSKHCVSCANGTDALYLALRALGAGPGTEVIVPAHSWISTSATVSQAGASVVFADTDPDSYTIDPVSLAARITPRTVGIVPVHLYGQPADMDAVMEIARRHSLWVLEDCAQAHLARYKGRTVGTFGIASTFSFYPSKNLGAMGDAGAVLTDDGALAERIAMIARHGGLKKGDHRIEGINSRLDGIQAAILGAKLSHLPAWTARRRELARDYGAALAGVRALGLPQTAPGREHVWHLYVVRHEARDALARHLHERGVQTVVNYPVALPFLPAYQRLRHSPADFPNAHRNQSRVLSLPMYPEMTPRQMHAVADALASFAG